MNDETETKTRRGWQDFPVDEVMKEAPVNRVLRADEIAKELAEAGSTPNSEKLFHELCRMANQKLTISELVYACTAAMTFNLAATSDKAPREVTLDMWPDAVAEVMRVQIVRYRNLQRLKNGMQAAIEEKTPEAAKELMDAIDGFLSGSQT